MTKLKKPINVQNNNDTLSIRIVVKKISFQGLSEDADRDGWVTKLQGKSIPGQQARVSAETANCFKTILDTFRHNQDIQLSFGNSRNRKPSRQAIVTIHTNRICACFHCTSTAVNCLLIS